MIRNSGKACAILIGGMALMATPAVAGTVVAQGTQTAGVAGRNASLDGKAVSLPGGCRITAVSGDNAGFWTQGTEKKVFYKQADAVGTVMQAGTYYVYPNLRPGAGNASIKVTFTCP